MIRLFSFITSAASRIDGWLDERLGRPYRVLLSVGLAADIGHRIFEAPKHVQERPHLAGTIMAVLMEVAMLLHQLAEMNEHLERRTASAEAALSTDPEVRASRDNH